MRPQGRTQDVFGQSLSPSQQKGSYKQSLAKETASCGLFLLGSRQSGVSQASVHSLLLVSDQFQFFGRFALESGTTQG
jgi:hypothetical protein